MADKDLADYAREAIERLPSKSIAYRDEMKQVISEAVKAKQLATIKPDDEDWVKRNKELTAAMLADLTSQQLDYQWDMLYVVWSSFIRQG